MCSWRRKKGIGGGGGVEGRGKYFLHGRFDQYVSPPLWRVLLIEMIL